MGKAGVGRLLELGREGELGSCHLAAISVGNTPYAPTTQPQASYCCGYDSRLFITADVLVWSELPTFCKQQCTRI